MRTDKGQEMTDDSSGKLLRPPVYTDVEDYRQKAIRRLESHIIDIDHLLLSEIPPAAIAALYMRAQNAIEMQGKLMGALAQGPPSSDRHEVYIDGVDTSRLLPPDAPE